MKGDRRDTAVVAARRTATVKSATQSAIVLRPYASRQAACAGQRAPRRRHSSHVLQPDRPLQTRCPFLTVSLRCRSHETAAKVPLTSTLSLKCCLRPPSPPNSASPQHRDVYRGTAAHHQITPRPVASRLRAISLVARWKNRHPSVGCSSSLSTLPSNVSKALPYQGARGIPYQRTAAQSEARLRQEVHAVASAPRSREQFYGRLEFYFTPML